MHIPFPLVPPSLGVARANRGVPQMPKGSWRRSDQLRGVCWQLALSVQLLEEGDFFEGGRFVMNEGGFEGLLFL